MRRGPPAHRGRAERIHPPERCGAPAIGLEWGAGQDGATGRPGCPGRREARPGEPKSRRRIPPMSKLLEPSELAEVGPVEVLTPAHDLAGHIPERDAGQGRG